MPYQISPAPKAQPAGVKCACQSTRMETTVNTKTSNTKRDLRQASDLLLSTWKQGRRVLVVLGAGVSVKAKVPGMKDVFSQIEAGLGQLILKIEEPNEVHKQAATYDKQFGSGSPELLTRLRELREWFASLARGGAPRSIAAMALGMMQRAHETTPQSELSKLLHEEWIRFSNRFISDVTTKKEPTDAHKRIAGWAISGGADLISVNFDIQWILGADKFASQGETLQHFWPLLFWQTLHTFLNSCKELFQAHDSGNLETTRHVRFS